METTEAARNKEKTKLDLLERQYWESFEASKNESSPGGDATFLTGVGKCIQSRAKLFGLDVPVLQKSEVLQLGGPALSESERTARLAWLLDAGRARAGAQAASEPQQLDEGEGEVGQEEQLTPEQVEINTLDAELSALPVDPEAAGSAGSELSRAELAVLDEAVGTDVEGLGHLMDRGMMVDYQGHQFTGQQAIQMMQTQGLRLDDQGLVFQGSNPHAVGRVDPSINPATGKVQSARFVKF